jgi:hypothetical protein
MEEDQDAVLGAADRVAAVSWIWAPLVEMQETVRREEHAAEESPEAVRKTSAVGWRNRGGGAEKTFSALMFVFLKFMITNTWTLIIV